MKSGRIRRSRVLALPRRVYRSIKRRFRKSADDPEIRALQSERMAYVAAHPADPEGHYNLARFYFEHGRVLAAIAECRTSLTFGPGKSAADLLSTACASGNYDGDGIFTLPSFVYQRIKGLASRISARFPNERPKVLDVGGGEGYLNLFLRECDYVLAEPSINGLLVSHFPDSSFDAVVACHVFEHIPADQKAEFLNRLCSVARRTVLLLGPLDTGMHRVDATGLIYKITQGPWAKEHLDCSIPSVNLITSFAAEHGIPCRVSPSGNWMSVYWAIFAHHFADCAGKKEELREAEEFANKFLRSDLVNEADPNEHLVELDLERRGSPK